jgi:CDP-diacylglycerol--glycerol-3-phosphate 3-phosphatidyltransferase
MNLPNQLTVLRLILSIFFVMAFYSSGLAAAAAALFLFVLAAVTDWADGYLARRYGLITVFGKIMDPVADKVMTLSAFFALASEGFFPFMLVVLVAVRELMVTLSRIFRVTKGQVIPAETLGKLKTVIQMVTIILALLIRLFAQRATGSTGNFGFLWIFVLNMLMIIVVALTIVSGIEYFRRLNSVSVRLSHD